VTRCARRRPVATLQRSGRPERRASLPGGRHLAGQTADGRHEGARPCNAEPHRRGRRIAAPPDGIARAGRAGSRARGAPPGRRHDRKYRLGPVTGSGAAQRGIARRSRHVPPGDAGSRQVWTRHEPARPGACIRPSVPGKSRNPLPLGRGRISPGASLRARTGSLSVFVGRIEPGPVRRSGPCTRGSARECSRCDPVLGPAPAPDPGRPRGLSCPRPSASPVSSGDRPGRARDPPGCAFDPAVCTFCPCTAGLSDLCASFAPWPAAGRPAAPLALSRHA
jgi:hypothetical protein